MNNKMDGNTHADRENHFRKSPGKDATSGRVTRRDFLKSSALAAAGLSVGGTALLAGKTATAGTGPVLEFKFAEIQPAQGIYARYEAKFGKLLEERTGGAVKIALFAGGALGGEKDVMEGLRMGSVHVGLMGLTLMPFLDVIWGPYVFRDNDHARKVLNGEFGQSWKERVLKESGGLRLIDYVYFGPRQLSTRNTPGRTPADLKGLKIRVMEAPIYIATWKALGANPVPMAWGEVFTGLQQGTIDAQENPLELIVSNSLFEVQKYVALTSHVRPYRFLMMNDAAFNKMSKDQQKIFVETWKEIEKEIEQEYIASDQKFLDLLKSKGVTIVQPDTNAYREATKNVWKEFMPKAWGEGVYEKVQAIK
jgi:tripartite ATP-independent transporter DctP family solute receptor